MSENCLRTPCKEPNCIKRHAKKCKYFSEHNFCKFNNSCAYIHKEKEENVELKSALKDISSLRDEIEKIKKNMKYHAGTKPDKASSKMFIDDIKSEIESLKTEN